MVLFSIRTKNYSFKKKKKRGGGVKSNAKNVETLQLNNVSILLF